jgi:hypothetical protein
MRRPMSRRGLRVFSIVFLTIATGYLGLYSWFVWDQVEHGIDTDAVVVKRVETEGSNLFVAFTTGDGRQVVTSFAEYSHPESHEVGQTIRIRYVPRDPRIARQADEPAGHPVFFIGGGFFFLVGVGLVVYAWRSAPAISNPAGQ